jgi:YD repeat-containing protein
MVAGVAAAVVPAQDASATPPGASPGRPVHVHPVAAHQVRIPVLPVARRAPAAWPSAGSATVGLSTATVRAGSLPVLVGPPTGTAPAVGKRTGGLAASPTEDGPVPAVATPLAVSMAAQSTVTALGLHGAVFSVADRSTGTGTAHRVHIALDYSGFADAFGGGFSGRLRLFALPACALTTPKVPACQVETPLDSANDTHAAQVGADVRLPGGSSGDVTSRTLVLAATTSTQGSGGNFGAEPVSEQTQWVTGDSSGAYTYTYPIELPPVPGGMAPTVSLNYDSQSVDGLDASTNNEASSIGDGWSYQLGFIENDYQTCATNPVKPDTLDLCAGTPEQTITLNGSTTPLVVTSAGSAHPEADGAQQVIAQSGGGYEVIEPDGTQYWFGRNKLPGFTTGDATTNSVWTVPLWQASGFANGVWRYMLDYVVDPNGNAVAYFYNTQTNYYAESNGQTAGTVANGAYTQGGSLAKIEYGLRANSVYTQPPAAQVTFTTGSTVRQDAPTDLACAMGATCHVTAPTFWTSFPLIGISTQALVNSTLTTVDSYSLTQSYPATGDTTTAPSLWLSSITRTGQDGSTPISLPPVSFSGTPMANLAATATDKSAGYSLITRYRLTHIVSDTGAVTTVAYSAESSACASGTFPKDQSNTGLCYPDYWLTNPLSLTDREDWYNLYDTASITNTDTTGGGPAEVASYTYSGPAWHYNADTTSVSANWTWDQWRGFRSVTIEAGTAPDPVAETVDTFLQGMSQDSSDFRFSGGKITNGQVNVTSSRGDVVEDKEQYAGMLFEQIVYNGAGSGNQVYDTIYSPWTSTATGSNSTFFQTSFIVGVSAVATYDALSGGGVRETTTTDTFNGNGQVLTENLVPDTANASENTCTAYTYTVNTTAWIVNLPSEVKVTGGASCATAVSDTRYTYDGGTLTTGNITKVSRLNATASGGTVMENYTYDQYGRTLTSQDPDNRTTITAYTPATGAEPTSVRETDPAGLATTTTYDPARGLETGQTDPAGDASAASYNALGQLTAEWSPGNPTTGPAVDKYAYTISDTAPSVITSQTEQPGGGYLTSDTIYDSLGRSRETQTQTASGGADVSDVSYNSDGVKTLTSDPYYVSSSPSGVLVAAAPSAVPSQTGYVYDGDGRVIKQISYALGVQTWETDTTYGGDHTTVVGPSGGTSDTTFSDGRGLTTAIYQYHSGVPADPADPAGDYDKTTYTYTAAGRLAGVTDAQGNTWSYLYDQLGDELNKTDPDSRTTTDSYDNAGQLTSSTDGAMIRTCGWFSAR